MKCNAMWRRFGLPALTTGVNLGLRMSETLLVANASIKRAADVLTEWYGLRKAVAMARQLEATATNRFYAAAVRMELERRSQPAAARH